MPYCPCRELQHGYKQERWQCACTSAVSCKYGDYVQRSGRGPESQGCVLSTSTPSCWQLVWLCLHSFTRGPHVSAGCFRPSGNQNHPDPSPVQLPRTWRRATRHREILGRLQASPLLVPCPLPALTGAIRKEPGTVWSNSTGSCAAAGKACCVEVCALVAVRLARAVGERVTQFTGDMFAV